MEQYWGRHPTAISTGTSSPTESNTESQPEDMRLHHVPYMRTSATVRRNNPQEEMSNSSGSYFNDLSGGPDTHGQWSSIKQCSHLSADPSSSIDRQLGLFAVSAVTSNTSTKRTSDTDQRIYKRVRSDLPEPSTLCKRSKKANKVNRQPSHSAGKMSEHIAQLRHKCLDFNWGKPVVEIKNRHKPEEAVATVRRRNMEPPTDPKMHSWLPMLKPAASPLSPTSSGPYLDGDTPVQLTPDMWRWYTGGEGFQEPGFEEIPSYLLPPSKQRFLQQEVSYVPQVPDGYSFVENPFLQSYPTDDITTATTSSLSIATPSHPSSRWDEFMMMHDDHRTIEMHAEDLYKSKFNED